MTGSRPIEVFTSKFSACNKTKGDPNNYICISNIAKKKDKEKIVKRPILSFDANITSRKLIKFINKIRSDVVSPLVDGQLSPSITRALTRTMEKEFIFAKEQKNKSSMLRKIYAELAWVEFGKGINKNVYIQDLLGHANLNTSFSYSFVDSTPDEVAN